MKFAEGNEHLVMISKREVLAECATPHRNSGEARSGARDESTRCGS